MSKLSVFVSHQDDTVEIKVPGAYSPGAYSPDVLSDMCNRASEMLTRQRMVGMVSAERDGGDEGERD